MPVRYVRMPDGTFAEYGSGVTLSEDEYEPIDEFELTEEVAWFSLREEPSGEKYDFKSLVVDITVPISTGTANIYTMANEKRALVLYNMNFTKGQRIRLVVDVVHGYLLNEGFCWDDADTATSTYTKSYPTGYLNIRADSISLYQVSLYGDVVKTFPVGTTVQVKGVRRK